MNGIEIVQISLLVNAVIMYGVGVYVKITSDDEYSKKTPCSYWGAGIYATLSLILSMFVMGYNNAINI